MIKFLKNILIVTFLSGCFTASAQTTTSSPYSQYGLGNLKGSFLPQNRAMGGIASGLRNLGSAYNNINLANPASYSVIKLTTFDIGASGSMSRLSRANLSNNNFNATFSHLLFAVPVNNRSALSFGLVPYSDLGYQFKVSSQVDTNNIDHIYSGDGGISKAYLGYGSMIGEHLSLGVNMVYLFGKLNNTHSTEFPTDPSASNSRTQKSNSLGGLNFDLGAQYFTDISSKIRFTLGYTTNNGKKLNSELSTVTTHYRKDFNNADESSATDTVTYAAGEKMKITVPMTHTVGFTFEGINKWLLGADFSLSNWSTYREGNINPDLRNSYGIAVGGQITPDMNAVSNYLKVVDYRMGFKYDKTYMNINNTDITQAGITLGLGLPLPANRSTFYKINFAAELGQRGTLNNNLVRERYINFYIGFLMNDKWFQRRKID